MLPMLVRAAALALLSLSLAVPPAAAQVPSTLPVTQDGALLKLSALGQTVALPLPDWLGPDKEADALAQIDASFHADDHQALLEIFPHGETAAFWSRRYGVHLLLDPDLSVADFRQALVNRSARTCRANRTGFFQLGEDSGDTLAPLGFVCGRYRSMLQAGRGEIMVMSFHRVAGGVAVLYQAWRGPAFQPADASSWPVAADTVETRARQLQDDALLALAD